jgi:penicillin amidase
MHNCFVFIGLQEGCMFWNKLFDRFPLVSRVVLWLVLPLLFCFFAGYFYLQSSLPQHQGALFLPGLNTATVLERDSHGVAYINADNDLDAYYTLGFAHAQDRLWQMEMNRRTGAGRLAEVFGEQSLPSDILVRRLGLYHNAKKIYQSMRAKDKVVLERYVAGVNAGIKSLPVLPPEYLISDFKPEPWRVEDSLVWMQMLSWSLSTNMAQEIQRTVLIQSFGVAKTNQIMPAVDIEPQQPLAQTTNAALQAMSGEWSSSALIPRRFIGSNSWVVSGKHTASGKPLLADDPHLANSLPSVWYLAGLKGDRLDVVGATFPGLPFVVIGKNRHIGWGMTTMMADTQDLFIEKINPLDHNQYEVDGQYRDMDIHFETIKVKKDPLRKSGPPIRLAVRRTLHGPVLSDGGGQLGEFVYSLRWTGDDQDGGSFASFVDLNHAQNWTQFNSALSSFVAPVHTFVYADIEGNIGLLAPGYIPVRAKSQGNVPLPGWQSENQWQGRIPFEQALRQYNPERGYIVTANNKLHDDSYPYHLGSDWSAGVRASRIKQLLEQQIEQSDGGLTVEHMMRIQGDEKGAPSKALLYQLGQIKGQNAAQTQVLAQLADWDGLMSKNSVGATIYTAWTGHFYRLLIEDDIQRSARRGAARGSLRALLDEQNQVFIEKVLLDGQSDWCDYGNTPEVESCQQILYSALDHAINELTVALGSTVTDWQWANVHKSQFPHFPLSKPRLSPGQPPRSDSVFAPFFHREIAAGGGGYSVNLATVSLDEDTRFLQFYGPGYRQIIDMTAQGKSRFIQNTGQSGNVLSRHYEDLIAPHQALQYLPMKAGTSLKRLTLNPVASADLSKQAKED